MERLGAESTIQPHSPVVLAGLAYFEVSLPTNSVIDSRFVRLNLSPFSVRICVGHQYNIKLTDCERSLRFRESISGYHTPNMEIFGASVSCNL